MAVEMDGIYVPSEEIVAREIEGELIIVPLNAGVGDLEDELFSLNETGREVWRRLDGKHTLNAVAEELEQAYEAPAGEIAEDVRGLVTELLKRKLLRLIA